MYTITITDNDIPTYDIGVINTTDANGEADSANVYCGIRGTVYGVNMRGTNGLQFTVRDATGGIGTFSATNTFGYTVNETDSVFLSGTISQFNGLTQMNIDTVILLGTGSLETPDVITSLGEITESDLIVMQDVRLVDPSQWNTGSSFNLDVTNGTDTITVRIDSDVDLSGMTAPTGLMDICGIGGQFDFSSPYNEGYQLLPRYMADVKPKVDLGTDTTVCEGFELNAGWSSVVWSTTETTTSIVPTTSGQYYVDVTYGSNTASDTINLTVNASPVADPIVSGPYGGDSIVCNNIGPSAFSDQGTGATSWMWDFGDNNTSTDQSPTHQWNTVGDSTFTVTLITSNGTCSDTATLLVATTSCFSVEEFAAGAVQVFPTITDGNITIDFNLPRTQRVQLMLNDLSGRQIMTQDLGEMNANREQLNLGNLPAGLYLLTVAGENQQATYKLMVR